VIKYLRKQSQIGMKAYSRLDLVHVVLEAVKDAGMSLVLVGNFGSAG